MYLVDHILLMEADPSLVNSIDINFNEVKTINFVPISDLGTQTDLTTPWMRKIIDSGLLIRWINDFKGRDRRRLDDGREFIKTEYSYDPVIKL